MKNLFILLAVLLSMLLAGCNGPVADTDQDRTFMALNFQQGQNLRYKVKSVRYIDLNWNTPADKQDKEKTNKFEETFDAVVAYKVEDVNSTGIATLTGKCVSVSVTRTGGKKKKGFEDAANALVDKSFTIKVDPTGKLVDGSDMEKIIKQAGKKAFRITLNKGKIKEPDLINDFTATQWGLWSCISSIEKPYEGMALGQSWDKVLLAPTPLLDRQERKVTYTLSDIKQGEKNQIAILSTRVTPSENPITGWPIPYTGKFNVSGTFGFLSSFVKEFKVTELTGHGAEYFNITQGRLEKSNQNYNLTLEATERSVLGSQPIIKVRQVFSITLM